jgi:glycosyltransferase involved in cell wall biosynthesis
MRKNILIVTHHFWPENFLINEVALKFSKLKHKVTVITGLPNYPSGKILHKYKNWKSLNSEKFKSIKIIRFPIIPRKSGNFYNLIINYISFIVSGIYYLRKYNFKNKFDHIFVYSTSPITSAILGIYLKKKYKIKLSIWIQDLWPESVNATGFIKNKFILYLIKLVVRFIYKNSNNIIAQSKAFKKKIKLITNKNIHVVENSHFNLNKKKKVILPKELLKILNNYFCVVFAGNIGKAQSIETILETAVKIKTFKKIFILIVGDGSDKDFAINFIKKNNLNNIKIFGPYNSNTTLSIIKRCKACLLTLKNEEIFSLTIPNKFQTYLYAGKPIIASVNGEVSKIIKTQKIGFAGRAEDSALLKKNIIKLFLNKKNLKKISITSKNLYKKNYDINKQSIKLLNIFNKDDE